jgi:hypothetical protein
MQIRLRWAISPEELVEEECGICGVPFHVESVVVEAMTESPGERRGVEIGPVCEECFVYLGERNPERFPSMDEYMYARQIDAAPIFKSEEAVIRAQDAGTFAEAFASSWIRH